MLVDGSVYTKAEALDAVRAIMHSYKPYEYINDDDAYFIHEVLKTHKEADLKIGCGVAAFQIKKDSCSGYNRFEIVRTDGSREDFSYKFCFNTPGLQPHQAFCRAMRGVVKDQISEFKKRSIVGDEIDALHVDHVHPMTFDKLCFDFVRLHQLDITRLEYVGDIFYEIVNKDVAQAFYAYHKEHAVLRVTPKLDNLKAPKSKVNWDDLNKGQAA